MASNDDDFLTAILTTGDQKIPKEMKMVKEAIATIETRTGINVREYIKFDKRGNTIISYHLD